MKKRFIFLLLTFSSFWTKGQTVKFSQVERAATKWHIPVGKRALPGLTGHALQYMDFVAYLDSINFVISGGGTPDTQYIEPLPAVGTPKNGFWLTEARDTVVFEVDQTVDYNNTNELQTLSFQGTQGRLHILPPGNSVQLPDSSAVNELQSITLDSLITASSKTYTFGTNPQTSPSVTRKIVIPLSSGGSTYVTLGSNFTSSASTSLPSSGLSFSIMANKRYHIRLVASYQTVATATGCRITFKSGALSHTTNGSVYGSISATAVATELKAALTQVNTAENLFTTSGVSAANSPHGLGAEFMLNAVSNDTVTLHFGSKVGGSNATLLAGSTIIITQTN